MPSLHSTMQPNRSCAHNYSTSSPEPPSSSTRPALTPSPMIRGHSSISRWRAHPRCASHLFSSEVAKRCRWAAEDVGQHNQGLHSSTIRSPSSWSSAIEWRLARHFIWPCSGSANVACDGSTCCSCSGGSRFKPTRVKADIRARARERNNQIYFKL